MRHCTTLRIDKSNNHFGYSDLRILQKPTTSCVKLQLSGLSRKDYFNITLLNDFSKSSKIVAEDNDSFALSLEVASRAVNFILSNTRINHVVLLANTIKRILTGKKDSRIKKYLLNWGFKKKKLLKLTFSCLKIGISHYADLLCNLMKQCNLSSLDFGDRELFLEMMEREDLLVFRPFQDHVFRFCFEYKSSLELHYSKHLKTLGLRLRCLPEFILQDFCSNQSDPRFSKLLQPPLINFTLKTAFPLQTLVLSPFCMSASNMSYLANVLKYAPHLKNLTIGIAEGSEIKSNALDLQMPTNSTVEEFTLELWTLGTEKDLNPCLDLFLGSIDSIFPSLYKFTLESQRWKLNPRGLRTEEEVKKFLQGSHLNLIPYLKRLSSLKNLNALSINYDTCKSISFDSFDGFSNLRNLQIVANSIQQSVNVQKIPPNVTNLHFKFADPKVTRSKDFNQLLSAYFSLSQQNNEISNNIEVLTVCNSVITSQVPALMRFGSLKTLKLVSCYIVDTELLKLLRWEGLVSLQEMSLSKTKISWTTKYKASSELTEEPKDDQANEVSQKLEVDEREGIFKLLAKTQLVQQLEVLDISNLQEFSFQIPKNPEKFKKLRVLKTSGEDSYALTQLLQFPTVQQIYHATNNPVLIDKLLELRQVGTQTRTIYLEINMEGREWIYAYLEQLVRRYNNRHHGSIKSVSFP